MMIGSTFDFRHQLFVFFVAGEDLLEELDEDDGRVEPERQDLS